MEGNKTWFPDSSTELLLSRKVVYTVHAVDNSGTLVRFIIACFYRIMFHNFLEVKQVKTNKNKRISTLSPSKTEPKLALTCEAITNTMANGVLLFLFNLEGPIDVFEHILWPVYNSPHAGFEPGT